MNATVVVLVAHVAYVIFRHREVLWDEIVCWMDGLAWSLDEQAIVRELRARQTAQIDFADEIESPSEAR